MTAAWHTLSTDNDYHDLGGDYFIRKPRCAAVDAALCAITTATLGRAND